MAQQTALDWFAKQIQRIEFTTIDTSDFLECRMHFSKFNELLEQAKAIEKEQIITAWRNGDNDSMYEPKQLEEQAKQYYNITYSK